MAHTRFSLARLIQGTVISIGCYCIGFISCHYKFFPYSQIHKVRNWIINDSRPEYLKNHRYRLNIELFSSYATSQADIIMLGDSITGGANWTELTGMGNVIGRGVGGDLSEGILNRLNQVTSLRPKKVYLMIGINDLDKGLEVSTIVKNYRLIIQRLLANRISPVIQSTLYTLDGEHSHSIYQLNSRLAKLAAEFDIKFIDLNSVLSIEKTLRNEVTYDGTHLNWKGYELWLSKVRATF